MKRILIDLTDIEGWNGHHGGTQRVVYGIAKQFFQQSDEKSPVEFMVFSQRDNQFYQTSFEPIYDRTEGQVAATANLQTQPGTSLQSKVKRTIRPYVPQRLIKSKRARASVEKALRLSKGAARRARGKISRHKSMKISSRGQRINFTRNDVVLILGKPWDSPGMEQALTNAKAETGFLLAQVIYDLIIPLYPHLHHPTLFKNYTQYIFEAIYCSDLLLPISKCTEKDLSIFAKRLNLAMPKTKVIRLADEITSFKDKDSKPDARISDSFIACVGTIEIRKNHTLLYYAYKLAQEQGIKLPQLVIVGSRGWLTGDFQYLVEHDPVMKDNILLLDNINDQGLTWIYENCMFTVYPSFYEGWGLPVAESLANGKACIASNTSSIPEIGRDIIDYFSPHDTQACLNAIIKYLDPKIREQKEVEIKNRYKPTSWENTLNQVIDGLASNL